VIVKIPQALRQKPEPLDRMMAKKTDAIAALRGGRLTTYWPHPSAPLPAATQTVCILTRYRGAAELGPAVPARSTHAARWRVSRNFYVDFYANARTPEYMIAMLLAFLARSGWNNGSVDVLADMQYGKALEAQSCVRRVEVLDFGASNVEQVLRRQLERAAYDAAVIAWPDALGFGNDRLIDAVLDSGTGNLVALNGRQRAFRLDRAAARLLRRRRRLANNRLGELVFAAAFVGLGAVLGAYDRMRRGTGGS
jgi:hypothetical protein